MRNTRGFTLIELMIVVAILAILAVVLAPLLGNGCSGETTYNPNDRDRAPVRRGAPEVEDPDEETGETGDEETQ